MVTITKATEKDAQQIVEIGIKTFLEAHEHSSPKEIMDNYLSEKFDIKTIKAELNDVRNIYHILYYKNRPAGYSKIIMGEGHPNINTPNITKLERIYLLKEFYGMKLGYQLFKFNLDLSKRNNQKGMWLFVWVDNLRAANFYIKTGFKIIGKHDFQLSPSHSNPNHHMFYKY